jgi:hypothetical protein
MKKIIMFLIVCCATTVMAAGYAGRLKSTCTTNCVQAVTKFTTPVKVEAIYIKYAVPTNTYITVQAQINSTSWLRLSNQVVNGSLVIIPEGLWLRPDAGDKLTFDQPVNTNVTIVTDFGY